MAWPCTPVRALKSGDFYYGLAVGVILTLIALKFLGRL